MENANGRCQTIVRSIHVSNQTLHSIVVRENDDRGGGFLRFAGFSPPVGCYYGPIPVMPGATLGGQSRRFGFRVHL